MVTTVATGAGLQAVSQAARYAEREKSRATHATPRRRLLDRLILRLLLYEDSTSSVDGPLDPPRDEEPMCRRVHGIVSAFHHCGGGVEDFGLHEDARAVAAADADPDDPSGRRWRDAFDGVRVVVDASTEVAYAQIDVHSIDADLGFVDALVGFQNWSGWTHALVPKGSGLRLYT